MTTTTPNPMWRLSIRGADRDLWDQLRIESIRRGCHAYELLNEIIAQWLEREEEGK